ncbi:glycosyltransferase family 4 protein [Alicyclobacillus fodiniaquatilis]|uniref:Glycosyltransferase family 4 protein n=1 Tax=Alicyclobacillus fodiniaquatilis TaxID=1661150 RepID=A0ABW4JPV7_9BACL
MEIVYVADTAYPDSMGGSHRYTYEVCKRLVNNFGFVVTMIVPRLDERPYDEVIDGIRYLRYDRKPLPFGGFDYVTGVTRLLIRISRKTKPDLIEVNWPLPGLSVAIWRKLIRMFKSNNVPRLVYSFHGPAADEFSAEIPDKMKSIITRTLIAVINQAERVSVRESDVIITASNYMKLLCEQKHFRKRSKSFSILGAGVDMSHFQLDSESDNKLSARAKLQLPDNVRILFTARRLRQRMGLDLLIEAMAELKIRKGQVSYHLFVAGRGPMLNHLNAVAHNLGVQDCVNFVGFVDDEELLLYYKAADLVVLPSKELEGFGLTVIESLASGTPVVATPVGGLPEVISGLDERLLSKGLTASDIASSIEGYFKWGPIEAQTCRNFVSKYAWEELVRQRVSDYQALVSGDIDVK